MVINKLFRFSHFRSRIIAFVLVIFVPIQLALFIVIRDANIATARANIDEALQVTADVFFKSLTQHRDSLLAKVRALSSDYAFKPVANTNEHKTVLSTLISYQQRVEASVMLLLSMDGNIIADTSHPNLTARPFYLPQLIEQASNSEFGEADSIAFIDEQPYLLVVVPLFSPEPSHWIVMGFLITDSFAENLQKTTKSQVSILYGSTLRDINNQWQQLASTLPTETRLLSEQALTEQSWGFKKNFDLLMDQQHYISVVLPIQYQHDEYFIALLQRSLAQALLPYDQLHFIVATGFAIALLLLIVGGNFIARKITQPVTVLAQGAKRIEQGHYDLTIEVNQKDELGQLAKRFNAMAKGLAERAKIRSLLGKVVSPAIAEQLLSKGVELGGEERQVTILFSDIRNFTSLCETHDAKEVLTLLNQLLTRLSKIIDNHHGVIDKYIGDAVMALFGVPINDDLQAQNTVLAALAMQQELVLINLELVEQKFAAIGLGIGINSANVIAGNMGSATRLNYTVIGDGVNLSSRLEGLTKYYGVAILVSQSTKSQCKGIIFQEIDPVRVKGKQQGLTIYQPLGLLSDFSQTELAQIQQFEQVLKHYKQQNWQKSLALLTSLIAHSPVTVYQQIYLDRLRAQQGKVFDEGWDGIFTHSQK